MRDDGVTLAKSAVTRGSARHPFNKPLKMYAPAGVRTDLASKTIRTPYADAGAFAALAKSICVMRATRSLNASNESARRA